MKVIFFRERSFIHSFVGYSVSVSVRVSSFIRWRSFSSMWVYFCVSCHVLRMLLNQSMPSRVDTLTIHASIRIARRVNNDVTAAYIVCTQGCLPQVLHHVLSKTPLSAVYVCVLPFPLGPPPAGVQTLVFPEPVAGAACRWVVRFGHQVTAKNPLGARRHIPNPNVSVKSLQSAAAKWVNGWEEEEDDDLDDDFESARGSHDEMTLPPVLYSNVPDAPVRSRTGASEMGAPLSVLQEEEGQGSVSPSGLSNSPGALN